MSVTNPFTASRITSLAENIRVSTRQRLVEVTRTKVAENQAAIRSLTGHDAPIQQYVDGSLGKPLELAERQTHTEFALLDYVVDAALTMLIERSPVGPAKGGHYRDDHWLFVNGNRRDAAGGEAVKIMPGDEIVIVNVRPYARKIEGGARSRVYRRLSDRRPGLSVQAPNGVYEISARDLQRRFGNIAKVAFTYRGLVSGAPVNPASAGHGKAHNVSANRYPSLIITAA